MSRSEEVRPHSEGRGLRFASRWGSPRVKEALKDFHSLNSRGARATFADHWIGLWARDFGDAWPMLYELLKIIEEDELFRDPRRVGPGAAGSAHGDSSSYDSFAAYFEDRVGQPFHTWAELEGTYRFVHEHQPELFKGRFEVARQAAALDGKTINADSGPRPAEERANLDNIQVSVKGGGGTSAEYLTKRIVRDHPDIAERMKAGEFTSVRAAALEAKIMPRTLSVRLDDPDSIVRSLRKHMSPEAFEVLRNLLADDH